MNPKRLIEEKKDRVVDASLPSVSFADFTTNILNQFLEASSVSIWLFGSILLIGIFLIVQNFSKETIFLPFYQLDSNKNLNLTLDPFFSASASGLIQYYRFLGIIKFSFNDLLKILLLFFLVDILILVFYRIFKKGLEYIFTLQLLENSPMKKLFDYLPRMYKEKNWIVDPSPIRVIGASGTGRVVYPQLRNKIPVMISNFKYIKFTISLLGSFDHWRAGIFITSWNQNQDWVYHIFKNENDEQLRSRIAKRIYSVGHVYENDQNIQVSDMQNFFFEIRNEKNEIYELYINKQLVDKCKIPKEDFKFIEISGWADDKPYKMEFSNIEMLG